MLQQVPEEIERVTVGIEAYLSIRRHSAETGLSFFENEDDSENSKADKVNRILIKILSSDLKINAWFLCSIVFLLVTPCAIPIFISSSYS